MKLLITLFLLVCSYEAQALDYNVDLCKEGESYRKCIVWGGGNGAKYVSQISTGTQVVTVSISTIGLQKCWLQGIPGHGALFDSAENVESSCKVGNGTITFWFYEVNRPWGGPITEINLNPQDAPEQPIGLWFNGSDPTEKKTQDTRQKTFQQEAPFHDPYK